MLLRYDLYKKDQNHFFSRNLTNIVFKSYRVSSFDDLWMGVLTQIKGVYATSHGRIKPQNK